MAPVRLFQRHSAALDWCEPNYVVSSYIAEFFNTISNVLFFVYPPIIMLLSQPRSREVAVGSGVVWLLFMVVGCGSVYFHATLAMMGQLMDEMAILWVVMAAMATWCPRWLLTAFIKTNINTFRTLLFAVCLIFTSISWIHPSINASALMFCVVPAVVHMVNIVRRSKSPTIRRLGVRLVVQVSIALACWLSDRLACEFWLSVHFPYMHAIWHLLIAATAAYACVVYSYDDAMSEASHLHPNIAFWPTENWHYLGVPYLTLDMKVVPTNEVHQKEVKLYIHSPVNTNH